MDWDLRTCARRGHATYAVQEEQFRERLVAATRQGEAWRCLRCGTYVPGVPETGGPAADAPVLLRGKELRSAYILRILAVERWVRGLIVVLLAAAVFRFDSTRVSVKELVDRDLSALRPFFDQIHFDVSDSATIKAIQRALDASPATLTIVGWGLLAYGILQIAEGVALWLLKRWGEYFALVSTALFLPLEVYELTEKITALRVGAFAINVVAVIYLLVSKRLFGVRGGGRAYEESRHAASLLEVQESSESSS
jgi:uncharacterized membrane protein (DUF2068 family)